VTAYDDPVGQFHRDRYSNNNPYRFTDPDGRQSWDVRKDENGKLVLAGGYWLRNGNGGVDELQNLLKDDAK
jgi:hypothetical protein